MSIIDNESITTVKSPDREHHQFKPSIKHHYKIVCILDEFSYECFKYESRFIQLEPESWKEIIDREKPDLLFVESAWKGKNKKWQHKISAWKNSKNKTICDIVNFCQEKQIPTVFWNKEDPSNFQFFIDSARHFDYIFTSDENSIDKYKDIVGHDRIYVLPFAAQPRLHNPIDRDKEKLGQIAFAGTWYNHKYENRRKNLNYLLTPALHYNLHIYNRMHNMKNKDYEFPSIYKPYIKGFLDYSDMIKAYKKYDVFLNVNSIEDSPTMCSRRVFEILACGTSIISNHSLAINKLFPGIVAVIQSEQEAEQCLQTIAENKEYRDKLGLLGIREVLNKHTYKHRLETVFDYVGLPYLKADIETIAVFAFVNSNQEIDLVINNYLRQQYDFKSLFIISPSKRLKKDDIINQYLFKDDITLILTPESDAPSKCVNRAVNYTNARYILLFEPYNYYAPNFMTDLLQAYQYADADIIGKSAYYEYDDRLKKTILRNPDMENCYVKSLCGSAMLIKKEIFDRTGFGGTDPTEDRGFFWKCWMKDIKLYSADRFNFIKNAYISQVGKNDSTLKRFFKLHQNIGDSSKSFTEISV